jgi:hypothetical protein
MTDIPMPDEDQVEELDCQPPAVNENGSAYEEWPDGGMVLW